MRINTICGEICRNLFFLAGILCKNQPTFTGKLIVVRVLILSPYKYQKNVTGNVIYNVTRVLHRALQGKGRAAVEYTCP